MKKYTIAVAFSLLALSSYCQNIVINEILSSNTTVNTDEDGTYQDWVELHNNSAASVSLNGFGLTDDPALPYKWVFPNVSMTANSYLLVWCSDKNRTVPGEPLHTNFKISASGETITLTDTGGTAVDVVPPVAIPGNISYGRSPDGTGPFSFFSSVTPGAANSASAFSEILPAPVFSQAGGFFTSAINVAISTAVPGASIIYTLDGSEPDAANLAGTTYNYRNKYKELPGQTNGPMLNQSFQTLEYNAPISIADRSSQPNKISAISSTYAHNPTYLPADPVSKGTVVKARIVKPGALSSPVVTETYFVNTAGSAWFSLPVISLSVNENKLFDYEDGIYVAGKDFDDWRTAHPNANAEYLPVGNYFRDGIANEIPANIDYFVNGVQVLNQNIGVRIHGGTTRAFESKSLNLYARADYGPSKMNYKFFNDITDDKFETLTLRNSGGDFRNTMFRDALNQQLVKSLHCETESYQPTVTFINGEYWGILNLREKYDDKYFSRVFNLAAGELDLLQDDGTIEEGNNADYLALTNYIENNSLAIDANYDYVRTKLDPDSFKDYFISNIFMDNGDWPGTNIQYWRKNTPYNAAAPYGLDGRYRWLFHDMDDTFSFASDDFNDNLLERATAANGPDYPNPPWSTLLLRKLLENPSFKNDFINRFADLMNTNFLSTRMVSTLNAMKSVIYGEIPDHISRWKNPANIDDYDFYIQYETDFSNARPGFQRDQIRAKFGIASNINATLDVDDAAHGYIKMNTIDVKDGTPGIVGNPYPWTGIYFSNIPVTVKAVANPGFIFSHWEGASTSTTDEITLTPASDFNLTAVFTENAGQQPVPVYFWLMGSSIPNDTPLLTLDSTYATLPAAAVIEYQSCLPGYPFTEADPNWRKASMERRNNPTPLGYSAEANGGAPYSAGTMKGLQITEPLQSNGMENIMVFEEPTAGYKDISFDFAAVNELTNATGIVVDYSVNAGTPQWISTGLTSTTLPLTSAYQLYHVDFTPIASANNNADFKIRLRFTGSNMEVSAGNRITFNNIALIGTQTTLALKQYHASSFIVYPNPFTDVVHVSGMESGIYRLIAVDGKILQSGTLENSILTGNLAKGMYLLELSSDGKTEIKKLFKK